MNYKKLIPNQDLRLKILGLADFIPDKTMIKLQYWIKTGRRLNLKNPIRYNEKLQWYKLYYRDPLMTQCADKYRVRDYVTSKGLKDILVPLYGAYNNADEINFDALPDKFVLKSNNGGGNSTNIICRDKNEINIPEVKDIVDSWLLERTPKAGREWSYYDIKPKVIAEKYLKENSKYGLIDYKFYCFNAEPHYVKVAINTTSTKGPQNGIFDIDFKQLPYYRTEVGKITERIEKPKNFKYMCEIAKKLSEDFPHVRVDLYNIDGKIYFGELTFYDTSGYQIFNLEEFDFILGELFTVNEPFFSKKKI